MIKDQSFTVSVVGDVSGETFRGEFRAVKFLTHRQQLLLDQKRRELLGANPDSANVRAKNQAEIFAQLFVRLTEAPRWWTESGSGLDLVDDNVMVEVFQATMKVEEETVAEMRKRAEAAKELLKKDAAE
jgi:hypothetical protein